MASLKDRLEAAGYDTSGLDEDTIIQKLDKAGYDTAGLSVSKAATPGIPEMAAQASNPAEILKVAAPSNLGKMAGVAAANAPGITSMLVNSLPGIGNPGAIPQAAANIVQNPQQGTQAASRAMQTQGGAQMTPDEQMQANMGQAAGTAMEMAGPALNEGVKATGPFTAGVKAPETAAPGALQAANTELGAAKLAAKAGDSVEETSRLRRLMSRPSGVSKVAEEAIDALKNKPGDLSVTQLLAYRKAAGMMQSQGGEFANDYKLAVDKASSLLQDKAPEVTKALAKARLNNLAADGSEFRLPALTMAVDPAVGAVKTAINAAKTAGVRNLAGAAVGAATPALPALTDIMNQAYDKVFKRKKRGA